MPLCLCLSINMRVYIWTNRHRQAAGPLRSSHHPVGWPRLENENTRGGPEGD